MRPEPDRLPCRRATDSGAGRWPALALLLSAMVLFPPLAADEPLAFVEVSPVVVPRERVLDGVVEAVDEATVSAQTAGRVAEVLFDVNDFVESGALIVRFTDTEQRAALDRARAAQDEARARATEAEADLVRAEELLGRGAISRSQRDQFRANRDAARARLASADAGVESAMEQLEYTRVRAPYAGIVSERHIQVGEAVRPGQPLMSGLSLQRLRVNVEVPQSIIDKVRQHDAAWVQVDGTRSMAESLTFFPFADPRSKTFRVRVNLPEISTVLYPGMFVKVGFVIGEHTRLLVPASAIVRRSELTAVYVVAVRADRADADGVTLRQVRVGRSYPEGVEVLAGLEPGERVALDPLRAGAELRARSGTDARHDGR